MKSPKIITEIICSPVGEGTSLAKYVKAAIDKINEFDNIRVVTHPMGTVFEASTLDEVFEVTKAAHNAIFELGAGRVVTQVRIDDRRDVSRSMEDKVDAVKD